MQYLATFDVGTTAVKGALVERSGRVALSRSIGIPTDHEGGRLEQDPRDWWAAFRELSLAFTRAAAPADIAAIAMSGQMQDLILLDRGLEPVGGAILYADGRAADQAARLAGAVGEERFLALTGSRCDGSLPLPKLMWVREKEPERYARTAHVLISAKDYLIARLTGVCCGDVTACSTAGAMDIRQRVWSPELLSAAGVPAALFPRLCAPHQQVGAVLAGSGCGYRPGTPVCAGIGDAGAATLASGAAGPGQYSVNLGTSGWVAAISGAVLTEEAGVFNLAAPAEGSYFNVVPFLNGGNVHRWAAQMLGGGYEGCSALLADSVPGSHGVLCLPYLSGERFPVLDPDVRGSLVGLTDRTTAADLARAPLEGVAFSLRQGLERLPCPPREVSLIGGGSREPVWRQILADVLGREIAVLRDGEFLPLLAVAAIALVGMGELPGCEAAAGFLRSGADCVRCAPRPEAVRLYDGLYTRFLRLYPALRDLDR